PSAAAGSGRRTTSTGTAGSRGRRTRTPPSRGSGRRWGPACSLLVQPPAELLFGEDARQRAVERVRRAVGLVENRVDAVAAHLEHRAPERALGVGGREDRVAVLDSPGEPVEVARLPVQLGLGA